MRTYLSASVLVLLVSLAGCAGGEINSPKNTMETFFSASNAGDTEKVKSCLIEKELKDMKENWMGTFGPGFSGEGDYDEQLTKRYENYKIHGVKMDGDRAYVTASWENEGGRKKMEWVTKKMDGKWKISIHDTMERGFQKAIDNLNED